MQDLKRLFQIQKFLRDIKYPDPVRIADEIETFLNDNPNKNLEGILKRLSKNEPWEYIKGSTLFCNNEFIVDSYVLIPRIETEKIVYDISEYILSLNENISLLDVGTGSGCIPISISKILQEKGFNKEIEIIATDISPKALDIAKRNEESILKEHPLINWVNTNLVKGIRTKYQTVVTANLPYIPHKQYMELDKSVKDYEPQIALEGEPELYVELLEQLLELNNPVRRIYIETEESVMNTLPHMLEETLINKQLSLTRVYDCFNRERFIDITLS